MLEPLASVSFSWNTRGFTPREKPHGWNERVASFTHHSASMKGHALGESPICTRTVARPSGRAPILLSTRRSTQKRSYECRHCGKAFRHSSSLTNARELILGRRGPAHPVLVTIIFSGELSIHKHLCATLSSEVSEMTGTIKLKAIPGSKQ